VKTILCVDDIQTNLYTLQALFEEHTDKYNIVLASSGQEALSVLLSQKIDMILLDIMMPEMDGYETAKLILSNKKTKDIPIIFLTAKKDDEAIQKCYDVGGVDYISKPYNETELFARIKFHVNLIDSNAKLIKEKKFAQDILDMQDNLIIITDGIGALRINKATSDFFDMTNFKDFGTGLSCLQDRFIKEDGYFHPDLFDDNDFWIGKLSKQLQSKDCLVLLEDVKTKKKESFSIQAKEFNNNYLISLTNITSIAEESKAYAHDAHYDVLTGVYNRSKLNDILDYEIKRAARENNDLSFVIIDIDHFKNVNDTYGHLVGDDVLIKMSALIQNHIRDTDTFARWGGEEFVLLLPNVDIDKAVSIANNLRIKIELEYFKEVNNITCSFGVTSYEIDDDMSTITARADEALYEAKENGRNQVRKLQIRSK